MAYVKVIVGRDGDRPAIVVVGDRDISSSFFPGDITREAQVLWNDPKWRKQMTEALLESVLDTGS